MMLPRFYATLLSMRNRHLLAIDLVMFLVSPVVVLALRTEAFSSISQFFGSVLVVTIGFLSIKLAIMYFSGQYSLLWRFASIEEMAKLVLFGILITGVQALLMAGVLKPLHLIDPEFPMSLSIFDGVITILGLTIIRGTIRLSELYRPRHPSPAEIKNVLVVGAGRAGIAMVKEMRTNPKLGLCPVGYADDDVHKHNLMIHGVRVIGSIQEIPSLVRRMEIQLVIIAMPTASGKRIREILATCERVGVPTKTMPGIPELLGGKVSVKQLRDVQIEDLLRRSPVQTDITAVSHLIRGRKVMVTGGGGSIGSELCRQVLQFHPSELHILGHGENSVFEIHNELLRRLQHKSESTGQAPSTKLQPIIADIRFAERIHAVFDQYRPDIVFHAAAHKHVPLMEQNPVEAITNNILGTKHVLDAARYYNTGHFIMISTDKAVNPTSIMGACKRVAELLVHRTAVETGRPYAAVRFGNVLGSRGSVVLTFKQQIANGGPITITHPDMRRYFMTIPEAVQLVLQAGALSNGGEVFTLDMGEPVKIVDLARDMIELSGLEVGRDIEINFVGLRPGEKMYEELFVEGETFERTANEKLFIACNASRFVPHSLEADVRGLEEAAYHNDEAHIMRILQGLVPQLPHRVTTEPVLPQETTLVLETPVLQARAVGAL